MRRRPPIEEPESRDRWIIPYADFITLLFAVFAVLYAISAVDAERFERMSEGIRTALSSPAGGGGAVSRSSAAQLRAPIGTSWRQEHPGVPVGALRDRIEAALEAEASLDELNRILEIEVAERGLVVSLSADGFFEPGSARTVPQASRLIEVIGGELATLDVPLRIEGHTDDRAAGSGFASNWEFSAARAASVARLLMERSDLDPSRLAVAGYAGFRPRASNDDDRGRARNRRVDLVVPGGGGASVEPGGAGRPERGSLSRVLDRLPLPGDPKADPPPEG